MAHTRKIREPIRPFILIPYVTPTLQFYLNYRIKSLKIRHGCGHFDNSFCAKIMEIVIEQPIWTLGHES